MNNINCDVCKKDYKTNSYSRHLTTKTHLLNNEICKNNNNNINDNQTYIIETTTLNKQDVISTITGYYEAVNNGLTYPDGETLKNKKIESIKKFVNNLLKDERNYKNF